MRKHVHSTKPLLGYFMLGPQMYSEYTKALPCPVVPIRPLGISNQLASNIKKKSRKEKKRAHQGPLRYLGALSTKKKNGENPFHLSDAAACCTLHADGMANRCLE